MSLQSHLSQSRLVRLLQEWAQVDGDAARHDVAERLGGWLGAMDTVKLESALQSIQAYASQARDTLPPAMALEPAWLETLLQRTRSDIDDMIAAKLNAPAPMRGRVIRVAATASADDAEADYAVHYQRYLDLQKRIELKLGQLRGQIRQLLAKGSVPMRQLAAMDAVMEQLLSAREQKLLSSVPVYLERRFTHWRQWHQQRLQISGRDDDPALWRQSGGWLAGFLRDWQDMLQAELQVRLMPVVGMIEAVQKEHRTQQ